MKRFLIGFFILLSGFSGNAQTRVITFEDAIRIALKNSLVLNTEKNNLEFTQAQKLAGIASLAPNIGGSVSASQFNGNSFNQQQGRAINGIRDNVSVSLGANLQLFNGFSSINYMLASNEQLDAQTYLVQRTTQDVMNTVSIQYLQVLLDLELLTIAEQNLKAQQKLSQQIKEQFELGSKSQVDEYNQNALTKGTEYRAVLARVTLDNDKALLAQTLQMDATEEFEVAKPQFDPGLIIDSQLSIDSLISEAKTNRADYLRAAKLERAASFQTRASIGSMLPTLVAIANIGTSYNFQRNVPLTVIDPQTGLAIDNPDYPRPFGEQMKTNNFYKQFGVQLNVPVFNGFRNRANYVQNRVAYRNRELIHRNLDIQLRNDVLRSVRTYEGSRKAYVVSLDQVIAADNAFALEAERYNLGITNFVDYTNANRAFIQAQTDKAQAEYRLVFQKILIDYATGTLRPEDILRQ